MKRIHDGAIGDIVAIEENFLRAPYVVIKRKPGLNEVEYQCSNQYHFTWLCGDDVPQSLVHNLDRATLGDEGADAGQVPRPGRALLVVRRGSTATSSIITR